MQILFVASLLASASVPQLPQDPPPPPPTAVVVVDHAGDGVLRERLVSAMEVWHDAGSFVVGSATSDLVETLERKGTPARRLPEILPDDELFVVDSERVDVRATLGEAARIVHSAGGQALVAAPAGTVPDPEGEARGFHSGIAIVSRKAWVPVVQLPRLTQTLQQAIAGGHDPRIDAMVAAASTAGLESDVQMLSSNFSRNSTVPSYIDGARNQIANRLTSMGYSPKFVFFSSQQGDNIKAEIPGVTDPDEWIVIGAHYDSRVLVGTYAVAPGADDNATGSAGVLEIARILAGAGPFKRSIRLMWFAGEEYGLLGSRAASGASKAAGEQIVGMINLDMTAYRGPNDTRDVDLVWNSTSVVLTHLFDLIGAQYVPGWASLSGSLVGGTSDHAAYTIDGYASVFPFEDVERYSPYIHSANDTYPQSTNDFELALMITRGALAGAVALAEPADLVISHTPLPDTTQAGPYAVSAQMTSLIGTTPSEARLHFSSNGVDFTEVAMVQNGSTWSADIPPLGSPVTIRYYITAVDDQGNVETLPAGAELGLESFSFFAGAKTVLYASGFEGTSDGGWTHGASTGEDDWQRGESANKAGDPLYAFQGSTVWGNDLGGKGFNGAYAGPAENWLRSPVVNCSQAANVTLSFRRWLGVEFGLSDQAQLLVNGQVVWQNPLGSELADSSWVPVSIDISALAAGKPAVQVEFRMTSLDDSLLGGWNIDAFELSERLPGGGGCLPPMNYCTSKVNSTLCMALMEYSGTPSVSSPEPFLVNAVLAINNKPGVLIYGLAADNLPFQGGTLCVKSPLKRTGQQISSGNPPPDDCSGVLSFDFNALIQSGSDPNLTQGTAVYCQYWYRDAKDHTGFGSGLTDALRFTICP